MKALIKIHSRDNVVIALRPFSKGEVIEVDGEIVTVFNEIEKGHKIALSDIEPGADIVKYGYPIGQATTVIKRGHHMHLHNVKTKLGEVFDYACKPAFTDLVHPKHNLTFQGYRRRNGEVGIRNEIWIVPTICCVNGIAEQIIREFKTEVNPTDIEGIEVFKHNYGCSQLGDDHQNTRQILTDIALHPDAGGVLILGLGCENNKIDEANWPLKKHTGSITMQARWQKIKRLMKDWKN